MCIYVKLRQSDANILKMVVLSKIDDDMYPITGKIFHFHSLKWQLHYPWGYTGEATFQGFSPIGQPDRFRQTF